MPKIEIIAKVARRLINLATNLPRNLANVLRSYTLQRNQIAIYASAYQT